MNDSSFSADPRPAQLGFHRIVQGCFHRSKLVFDSFCCAGGAGVSSQHRVPHHLFHRLLDVSISRCCVMTMMMLFYHFY